MWSVSLGIVSVDVDAFLKDLRTSPNYSGQIVYVREAPAREAVFAHPEPSLAGPVVQMLRARGIERLYCHQAEAIEHARAGRNPLVVTGTASGKSLCYLVPILERLLGDPDARILLLFPTKALCQDQFRGFSGALKAAGLEDVLAGVYDGDTPSTLRRKLRECGRVVFSNPDMLHAGLMPQHSRWAEFLADLRLLVIDELHVYSGIFGSNAANLFRRFFRLCAHYGSDPRIVAASATTGNPKALAEGVLGKEVAVIDRDGSPKGKRTFAFWNPPVVRRGNWRSRRSANVEAHELMAALIQREVPTIAFSKAKMTAEMIHRYLCETLEKEAPHLVRKVTPYRGGYRPAERREIERRLFGGELLGVSATPALELGIDIGGLDASILVGYPGTLASFLQQAGRAGRQDRDSLVILIGLDTAVNQYVMSAPEYLFGRPVEQGVIDPDNPFVLTGHLRCAAHELPLSDADLERFGPHGEMVMRVLAENRKVKRLGDKWYHAASEIPQHEVSLRDTVDANVLIENMDTGEVIGEVNKLDAPPILHPGAIYMHLGETYRVEALDLEEKNLASVKKVEVDYYTQPRGGTDVHHVDHCLREKPFGAGKAFWGEVTAYFQTGAYEKIHFYSLDAISVHGLNLPTFVLETMAFWIVPPDELMEEVRRADLDAHAGLRGIGYATRMLLPLFMTCDTLDFSHSIGSVNSPWNAIFVYERYPHGLGFTAKAYERLGEIMSAVLEVVRKCACDDGCPRCVGKPLRQFTTWNVERGEASIPSKAASRMILEGLLRDDARLHCPDSQTLSDSAESKALRLEKALRRRLERMREPEVFHPIEPKVETAYPETESRGALTQADSARRSERRERFERELRKRIAKKIPTRQIAPLKGRPAPPEGMKTRFGTLAPTHFPGEPDVSSETGEPAATAGHSKTPLATDSERSSDTAPASGRRPPESIRLGDALASKARRLRKKPRASSSREE